jgi:hypothetical protein
MLTYLILSCAAAIAAAAPALFPLGIQVLHLLLWVAAHAGLFAGFCLLCKAIAAILAVAYAVVRLILVWPRLKSRFRW